MKYFFSGISSIEEGDMLFKAGVTRILVDPTDLHHTNGTNAQVALDSGTYRAFKNGTKIDVDRYLEVARSRSFDFVVSPDVLGDMDARSQTGTASKTAAYPWSQFGNGVQLRPFCISFSTKLPLLALESASRGCTPIRVGSGQQTTSRCIENAKDIAQFLVES